MVTKEQTIDLLETIARLRHNRNGMPLDAQSLWLLLIASLGGAAIGMERQWSGHATGPAAHFAGIRTFTLLGLLAGLAGLFWAAGLETAATALLAGAVGIIEYPLNKII